MLGEGVDSLNPFLGFQAPSYEMWAPDLRLPDRLLDEGHVAGSRAWPPSGRPRPTGKTWTFNVRSGVKWSDGVPLTAADVAYTYNRVLHGTVEAANWAVLPQGRHDGDRAGRHHVVLKLKKPNAMLPLLPIPIVPEHIWKNVSEKEIKSYARRADGRQAGRRLRSVPAGRRAPPDGSTFKFEANPDYWGGAPHIDEVDLPVLQERRPGGAGADQGRGRLRRGHHAAPGEEPAGPAGHHRAQRQLARASTRSRSTPARSTPRPASRSATPTRRCWTRSSGTRSATRSTCRS